MLLGKQPAKPAADENAIDLRTPKTVPENARRGDQDLIRSRGGTILPDDDPKWAAKRCSATRPGNFGLSTW